MHTSENWFFIAIYVFLASAVGLIFAASALLLSVGLVIKAAVTRNPTLVSNRFYSD